MSISSPYDILFESVRIGPVTAPNRFYQVPHCSGMGYALPKTLAGMRAIKAEGGWGTVNTEYCSIHPTSDDTPYPHATLWDEGDLANLALVAEKIHEHGSLAGVELWHGGSYVSNLLSRVSPLGVHSLPSAKDPVQAKRMTRRDIRNLRAWQVGAAKRAMRAGFDLVYVYAAHGYLLDQFLNREINTRSDEYGGQLENRIRIVREMIQDTKEAVGHQCGIAVRFAVDSGSSPDGCATDDERRDMLAMLANLPDLWDVTVHDYDREMGHSRFETEGALERYVSYVRTLTEKPVVGVGRFTSPDTMVRMVKQGVLDLIGAARPSIADPFLPNKIREGRVDEIRECIGCNVCYLTDYRGAPIRCTQNPTMGEEWRRGWHPEEVPQKGSDAPVLVVGAGPAGLEATHVLGKRGYPVTLAERTEALGGRLNLESRLPGLSEFMRVRDYRVHQISRMPNVEIYMGNDLTAADVLSAGFSRVIIATGSHWRNNGVGRYFTRPADTFDTERVVTPDDIMRGAVVDGRVVVFDDDHYYLGTVLAELLAGRGCSVTYVTTEGRAGAWSERSQEQFRVQRRLLESGVDIVTDHAVSAFRQGEAEIRCIYTGRGRRVPADVLVPVTSREPAEGLYTALRDDPERLEGAGIHTLTRVGDCSNPGIIASAVYSGHLVARTLDAPDAASARRERVFVGRGVDE